MKLFFTVVIFLYIIVCSMLCIRKIGAFKINIHHSFINNLGVSFYRQMSLKSLHHHHEEAKKTVLVPIADGTEEIEAVTVIDTLVRAGADVCVASVTGSPHVVCSRGVKLTADCLIHDCMGGSFDAIVCPGGMPGAKHLSDSESVQQLLKSQLKQNKIIGAICAAPAVVLAHHNLLHGKAATCYPAEKFMNQIVNHSTELVVRDGNIITSQGPGTSLLFSLKLVEALFGEEKVAQLKREMIVI